MYPILFNLGPLKIYSYGFMLALAFLVASFLIQRDLDKKGIDKEISFNLTFFTLIWGILGARFFYVILHFEEFKYSIWEIFKIYHGGLTWYGGLTFGLIFVITYLKLKKIPILLVFDTGIPYIALAQSIGRIGCLLNGCCFGKASFEYGLYFPVYEKFLIPTQLISSLALLLIYGILRCLSRKDLKPGIILFTYLFLYSTKRFFIEFLRADSPMDFGPLSIFQIISLLIMIVSLVVIFILSNVKRIRS
ncbi:MAG: prolipoprotein diacylglyceryl transferase [Candidatus Omnitrophota bacterium]